MKYVNIPTSNGSDNYDCRHTAITRLAEAGVPTDVIMSIAGHVTEKMRKHYTHISQASQRKWLEHAQGFHQGQGEFSQSRILSSKDAKAEINKINVATNPFRVIIRFSLF